MNAENPFVVLTFVVAILGTTIAQLATSVPSPGEPAFPGMLVVFGAIVGTAWHFLRVRAREGAQETAFLFSMAAGGVGMAVYIGCLVASLL